MKRAKQIGLTIPPNVLVRADRSSDRREAQRVNVQFRASFAKDLPVSDSKF